MKVWRMNGQTMMYFNWAENQPDLKNHVTIGRNSFNHKVFFSNGYFLKLWVRLHCRICSRRQVALHRDSRHPNVLITECSDYMSEPNRALCVQK